MAQYRARFEIQLFHPGLYYDQPVKISEVVRGQPREFRFDPDLFDYGKNNVDRNALSGLAFAGFRVHFPLNNPKYKDEVLGNFQGASYFRALGKDQRYGLSARGLAVDTALSSGEEFPRFTEFWIEWPKPGARELTIYALLDSKRVARAYRFVLTPGNEPVTQVQARLFLRENVTRSGSRRSRACIFTARTRRRSRATTGPKCTILISAHPVGHRRVDHAAARQSPTPAGHVACAAIRN